ncbi:MAG: SDR family NAD(P)-dependent oxidoreductase [Planctomycetota bacterium]
MSVGSLPEKPYHRVLVTGAAGFIGSTLVDGLLADGIEVVGIDNFDPYYDPARKHRNLEAAHRDARFQMFEGDILDPRLMQRVFREGPFDVVVHLAAKAGVRPSILDPDAYFAVNVQGTVNLLHLLGETPKTRFVMASSSSVYGNCADAPFGEGHETSKPVSPYAASKKAGEVLAHSFHQLYRIPMSLLRFFTVYGPRQRPEMAIAKFFDLIGRGQSVPMFGDGTTARDYTFVDDIVAGIRRAMGCCAGFEIYNLGNSSPVTLSEMIAAVGRAVGKEPVIERLADQPGDVTLTCADVRKAAEHLGYAPETSLDQGLQRYRAWMQAEGLLPEQQEKSA